VLAAALAAPAARADGDPASDYLIVRNVFLSFSEGVKLTPAGKRLLDTVDRANRGGYRIKVAVIATPTDLGAVGGIFGQPQRYAQFLATELSFVYHDRLLIVMPAGFGIFNASRPVAAAQATLRGISIGRGVEGLDDAGATAVAKLATAAGVPVDVATSSGDSAWYATAWFLALVAGCAAATIAVGLFFGRRWLNRAAEPTVTEPEA
jgi:hypothetical protein